jgi:hypothetical protein
MKPVLLYPLSGVNQYPGIGFLFLLPFLSFIFLTHFLPYICSFCWFYFLPPFLLPSSILPLIFSFRISLAVFIISAFSLFYFFLSLFVFFLHFFSFLFRFLLNFNYYFLSRTQILSVQFSMFRFSIGVCSNFPFVCQKQ